MADVVAAIADCVPGGCWGNAIRDLSKLGALLLKWEAGSHSVELSDGGNCNWRLSR